MKKILILTLLLLSCQSPDKEIPGSAFADIKIYFNKDINDCATLEPVTRKIPKMTNIEAQVLAELFEGPNENESGYNSIFSFSTKDILHSFHIIDKKAYVDLIDIRQILPNSSCVAKQLIAQMDATIKQFGTAEETLYAINGSSEDFYEWLQMEAPESFPDKF